MVRDGFPYDSNATECEKYTPKLLSDGWANVAYILLFAPAAGAVFSPGVRVSKKCQFISSLAYLTSFQHSESNRLFKETGVKLRKVKR